MYYFDFCPPVFQREWAVFWPEAQEKLNVRVEDRESNEETEFNLMYIKIT